MAGLVVALHDLALAGGAGAVSAAVRKHDAGRQCRIQHGLPIFHSEFMPTGQHGDLETHIAERPGKRFMSAFYAERRSSFGRRTFSASALPLRARLPMYSASASMSSSTSVSLLR